MQEEEFDQIIMTVNPKNCKHIFVKLYYLGAHSDYGCRLCKIKTMNPELYTNIENGNQKQADDM